MKPATAGAASVHIDTPPEHVYGLVSDVTRMGEWSPETYRCRWVDAEDGPRVGARFKAYNRHGRARWSNTCEVVAAEPGREFAFRRTAFASGTVVWRYLLEDDGAGTRVSESYEVMKPGAALGTWFQGVLFGVDDRDADLVAGMQATLERLKKAAESVNV
jgi:uncharacterized protein YndB with AHSA1/START domain